MTNKAFQTNKHSRKLTKLLSTKTCCSLFVSHIPYAIIFDININRFCDINFLSLMMFDQLAQLEHCMSHAHPIMNHMEISMISCEHCNVELTLLGKYMIQPYTSQLPINIKNMLDETLFSKMTCSIDSQQHDVESWN